ncbi:MAG: LysR family transcriptional regulator [Qingshengfaniella sp.]
MDTRYLAQLAVIVELGSISRAAEHLNLTQPTLSRTVKVIEDRVGSAVLRRGRYGVTPTVIGAQLAEEGQEILARSRRAQRKVEHWKRGLSGELRIGMGPLIGPALLADFMAEPLRNAWPYAVSVYCEPVGRLFTDLAEQRLDVVLGPTHLALPQGRLVQIPLFSDRNGVFGSAEDPLTQSPDPVPSEALGERPWIEIGSLSGLRISTRVLLASMGLPDIVPRQSMNGDVHLTARVVRLVRGLCFLSLKSAPYYCAQFGLAQVPLTVEMPLNSVSMWVGQDRHETPMITHFHSHLSRFLARNGISDPPA